MIKSMLVIGGANVANILISIVRLKLLALMLGPVGIGLLGIYNNLLGTVSTAAGLGLGSSGVRQIASTKGDEAALARVRVVLLAGNVLQGALGMAVVWLARDEIAHLLFGDTARATEVGLTGIAVLLGLVAASQTALLQGMRRIGDLGRVTVYSAMAGTFVGLLAVWLKGEGGLIWFVVAQPLTSVVVAAWYTRKLPRATADRMGMAQLWAEWRPMAALGVVFMLGGLVTTGTLLLVRGMITNQSGLEGAGLFAASWGISMQYIGFLLGAMGADYYPRLTEVIDDQAATNRLMNDQAQLGLALGGPVLLLLIGLAPWLMTLFYSGDFASASEMLQWQTVGNIFKLASWPLGFALVAAARSRIFLFTELSWNALFLVLVWGGLPIFGLQIAGTAFLVAYVIYLGILNVLISRLHGFRWQALSLRLIAIHGGLAFVLLALAYWEPLLAAAGSIALALITGVAGLRIVLHKVGPEGRLATRANQAFAAIGWPLKRRRS